MKLLFSLAAVIFLATGCSTAYKIPEQSLRDGPYPTSSKIKPDNILIKKPYSGIESIPFVVTKISSGYKAQEQTAFLKHSLNDLGISEVLTEDELVAKIFAEGLDEDVSSASDMLALKKLSDYLGNFLVIEWTTDFLGNSNFKTEFIVTDPTVPERILEIREGDVLWVNFDTEFTYPIINLLREVLLGDVEP